MHASSIGTNTSEKHTCCIQKGALNNLLLLSSSTTTNDEAEPKSGPSPKGQPKRFSLSTRWPLVALALALLLGLVGPSAPLAPPNEGRPSEEAAPSSGPNGPDPAANSGQPECGVISDVDKNYLTPIDVVVKSEDDSVACIRARFALSIRVDEARQQQQQQNGSEPLPRFTLGYLPLENVLKVEQTCPDEQADGPAEGADKQKQKQQQQRPNANSTAQARSASDGRNSSSELSAGKLLRDSDELEMIVTFECGKLSFTFQRDENKYFMSSIKGLVKLGEQPEEREQPFYLVSHQPNF